MNKQQLESRVAELKDALEKSAAQHNALLGRLSEAMHLQNMMELHEKAGVPVSDLEMVEADATCAA